MEKKKRKNNSNATAIFCFANHSQWDLQGETKIPRILREIFPLLQVAEINLSSASAATSKDLKVLGVRWTTKTNPSKWGGSQNGWKTGKPKPAVSFRTGRSHENTGGSECAAMCWENKQCVLRHFTAPTNPGRRCNKHVIQGFHCTCWGGHVHAPRLTNLSWNPKSTNTPTSSTHALRIHVINFQ